MLQTTRYAQCILADDDNAGGGPDGGGGELPRSPTRDPSVPAGDIRRLHEQSMVSFGFGMRWPHDAAGQRYCKGPPKGHIPLADAVIRDIVDPKDKRENIFAITATMPDMAEGDSDEGEENGAGGGEQGNGAAGGGGGSSSSSSSSSPDKDGGGGGGGGGGSSRRASAMKRRKSLGSTRRGSLVGERTFLVQVLLTY